MLSFIRLFGRIGPAKNTSTDEVTADAAAPAEVDTGSDMDDLVSASDRSRDGDQDADDWLIAPVQQFSDFLDGTPTVAGADLREQMEDEKKMYPGASTWAKPEEDLFEALFLRQDRPLLPSHWNLDFRGMPMSASVFDTSDKHPPVIYTQSQNDFHGTDALTRLIDLTADVRTIVQCGLRRKAPRLIKKGLEAFITWAARDGGYSHLKYVPNIMVSIVPRKMNHQGIDTFMQMRMRSLSLLQREFLRTDRTPDFWETIASPFLGSKRALERTFGEKHTPFSTPQKRSYMVAEFSPTGSTAEENAGTPGRQLPHQAVERQRISASDGLSDRPAQTKSDGSESRSSIRHNSAGERDTSRPNNSSPRNSTRPKTPVKTKYRRQPPVVYGLFIVGTSVFLLTLDSSKGDEGYVSFHLELNFLDSHQSVWNGLTLAIAVCLARDELIARSEDFEELPPELETDPDE